LLLEEVGKFTAWIVGVTLVTITTMAARQIINSLGAVKVRRPIKKIWLSGNVAA